MRHAIAIAILAPQKEKNKMKRKAQTEILGVAVIVIILIIAGGFMIGLSARKKPLPSDSFIDPELADSFVYTIAKTKTEKNVIVSDMIDDCHSNRQDLCGLVDCCDYAHDTIKNAMDATLGNWSRKATLSITQQNNIQIDDIIVNGGCGDFDEQESPGYHYIVTTKPHIVMKLQLCK